jgi:hypothetical protein
VFAGAVSAVALFALFGIFWMSLAYSNIGGGDSGGLDVNVSGISDNLAWYLAGSAVAAMLIGGFIAGWFSGLRGSGAGALDGFIMWGVTLFGAVVFGAPSVLGAIGVSGNNQTFGFNGLWETFFGIGVGLVAAVVGGAIGGAVRRPSWLFKPQAVEVTEIMSESPGVVSIRGRQIDLRMPMNADPTSR